ncbi:MAG: hypothetical protein QOE68_2121 [Thermoanaerobaculia bacterium]|nr:hypothetical protein [Thermoanaerobaculia bacterium]
MIARLSDRAAITVTPIDPSPLLGQWINYDTSSRSIAGLTIAQRGEIVILRITGAPDVDWGETSIDPYSLTTAGGEAAAFRAGYDFKFARIAILAYLNKRLLVVDAYTTFHDDSGRSNYFARDHFWLR